MSKKRSYSKRMKHYQQRIVAKEGPDNSFTRKTKYLVSRFIAFFKLNNLPSTTTISAGKEKRKREEEPVPVESPSFECIICLCKFDSVVDLSFGTSQCDHQVCQPCIRQYFESALRDTRYTNYDRIQCPSPDCEQHFITEKDLTFVFSPAEVEKWWISALTRTHIKNKICCPMDNCNAVYDVENSVTRQCTFTECYECHRGFCGACGTKWHTEKLKKPVDDKKEIERILKYAEKLNWSRCPSCAHLIEKEIGCMYMRCHCGKRFCYRCGGDMIDHYTCNNECHKFTKKKLDEARSVMFANKKVATTTNQ